MRKTFELGAGNGDDEVLHIYEQPGISPEAYEALVTDTLDFIEARVRKLNGASDDDLRPICGGCASSLWVNLFAEFLERGGFFGPVFDQKTRKGGLMQLRALIQYAHEQMNSGFSIEDLMRSLGATRIQ